jgi:hypothetical protein
MNKRLTMTHKGIIFRKCDLRISEGQTYEILLGETKSYWISSNGTKYSKKNGNVVGSKWAMYKLDISTVKENRKKDDN